MYIFLCQCKLFNGQENYNPRVLQRHTLINVFVGSLSSFDQHENGKPGQCFHTGPLSLAELSIQSHRRQLSMCSLLNKWTSAAFGSWLHGRGAVASFICLIQPYQGWRTHVKWAILITAIRWESLHVRHCSQSGSYLIANQAAQYWYDDQCTTPQVYWSWACSSSTFFFHGFYDSRTALLLSDLCTSFYLMRLKVLTFMNDVMLNPLSKKSTTSPGLVGKRRLQTFSWQ